MADLINKQDVLNEIVRFSTEEGSSVECQQLYCDVNNMPAYKEPNAGKWIETDSADPYWYMCSECHRRLSEQEAYCPSCGAKMK